jgi:hypothetical protein
MSFAGLRYGSKLVHQRIPWGAFNSFPKKPYRQSASCMGVLKIDFSQERHEMQEELYYFSKTFSILSSQPSYPSLCGYSLRTSNGELDPSFSRFPWRVKRNDSRSC